MTILVVDDSEPLHEILTAFLEEGGHTVDCASNSRDALAIYERGTYDVVLTDEDHPGLSGTDMAAVMLRMNPKQAIGMMSTYTNLLLPTIRKPFFKGPLLQFVEELARGARPQ